MIPLLVRDLSGLLQWIADGRRGLSPDRYQCDFLSADDATARKVAVSQDTLIEQPSVHAHVCGLGLRGHRSFDHLRFGQETALRRSDAERRRRALACNVRYSR